MSSRVLIDWEDLHSLFSIVMCVNESMEIIYASDTLIKHVPSSGDRLRLGEVFETLRPSSFATFEEGVSALGSLCLMTARDASFAIRGQLISCRFDGENTLCLCGAPWLFWINSNRPETQLGLTDFSAQDVQLDQLFFMSTERQMVDDLEQLNDDLSNAKSKLEETQQGQKQFFAQMSHEIRTPLNGVVSALALLEDCPTVDQQSQFLALAQQSSRNLMQVINYVLTVSKLELSQDQDPVVFSWAELVQSTADVVRAKAQEKPLGLSLELAPDLPRACYGFPAILRQTLLNLLINAIKFTNHGAVSLRVILISRTQHDCVLRVEVADTGAGIPEEHLDKIFTPFWSSLPGGGRQHEEGTGLGLDIVRRNVQSMGGEIQVKSTLGEGTTFWFELPVNLPVDDREMLDNDAPESNEDQVVLAGNVLLVDDNETNLLLGSFLLQSLGLEVTSADGGNAAVTTALQGGFDLVLMDISMPDIDGLEATRLIRESLDGQQLPIVALTAHVDRAEIEACLAIGMNGYLTKPIVKDQLRKELASWLGPGRKDMGQHSGNGFGQEKEADKLPDLVDESVLQTLVEQVGKDNLELVIEQLRSEVVVRWSELELAQLENDTDAVRRHVHSLASIFRSVGLMVVGDSFGAVEELLKSGGEPAEGWLQELLPLRLDSMKFLDLWLQAL